jgi:hypothetical protein
MFRVVNLDMTFDEELDIIAEGIETLEEAKRIELDNYYFNTSVEQYVDGEWKEVLLNGMNDEEWKDFGKTVDSLRDLLRRI